jgi:AraC-like DNA-binding protein
MGFARWRQQLGVVLAVKWMADGATIKQVAADLGYERLPSFVTMFERAVGTSPGRYMAKRRATWFDARFLKRAARERTIAATPAAYIRR